MTRLLHLDLETRSACDLTKRNVYVYADDPTTGVWLGGWAFDDDEPVLWHPSAPCPPAIAEHVAAGGLIVAWNAQFERVVWEKILGPRHGWPVPRLEQFRCVMAEAYALGLPGKLEKAAPALGVEVSKDMAGHALMLRMCRPRRIEPDGTIVWWDEPEKLERLGAYCLDDVRTEQACYRRLLRLRPSEQKVWFFDQRMNDRGVFIDAELCRKADAIAEAAVKRLNVEMRRVTDDEVRGVTNTAELVRFCKANGVETDSVAKEQVEDLLVRDDLPDPVRQALEIRQEGGKTSVAKIGKLLSLRQADGRMRGNLQYHGAGTGRWAARGAQLQNLPRPDDSIWSLEGFALEDAVADIMAGRSDTYIEVMYGPPMTVVSDAIRGMIAAPPGRKILAADLSQIEARMTLWLGGQADKLDVFRAYDAGQGPDVYTVQASQIYGEPIAKKDERRQTGKVAVLSLGFQGGAWALLKMARKFNLHMDAALPAVWAASGESARERALDAWQQRGNNHVSRDAWLASELVKIAWRASNPAVVDRWRDCEEAAIAAVEAPGSVHDAGALRYRVAGSWLFCRLPSGRALAYAYPKVELKELPWDGPDGKPAKAPGLTFMGVNGVTKKWEKQSAYGGLLFQNGVQGAARDVMVEGLLRAEDAGYEPVLTIHDEGVFEADEGFGSAEELCAIMVRPVAWAAGLPIAAEAFEARRYRK